MEFYFNNEDISSGTVIDLKCFNCNLETLCFKIIGSSWAMNFLGIIGVFEVAKKELFITKLTLHEFQNYNNLNENQISNRLKLLINRENLIFLKNHSDENNKIFKKCPECKTKLEEIKEQNLADFTLNGGKIYTINSYEKQ